MHRGPVSGMWCCRCRGCQSRASRITPMVGSEELAMRNCSWSSAPCRPRLLSSLWAVQIHACRRWANQWCGDIVSCSRGVGDSNEKVGMMLKNSAVKAWSLQMWFFFTRTLFHSSTTLPVAGRSGKDMFPSLQTRIYHLEPFNTAGSSIWNTNTSSREIGNPLCSWMSPKIFGFSWWSPN